MVVKEAKADGQFVRATPGYANAGSCWFLFAQGVREVEWAAQDTLAIKHSILDDALLSAADADFIELSRKRSVPPIRESRLPEKTR